MTARKPRFLRVELLDGEIVLETHADTRRPYVSISVLDSFAYAANGCALGPAAARRIANWLDRAADWMEGK